MRRAHAAAMTRAALKQLSSLSRARALSHRPALCAASFARRTRSPDAHTSHTHRTHRIARDRRGMSAAADAESPPPAPSSTLPALFWSAENGDDWMDDAHMDNPEFAALKAMLNEDPASPRELAEMHKSKGNESMKYKANPLYARYAVEHYTTGILVGCDDATLNSMLHSNRAYAALILKNYRKAHTDGVKAVEYDGTNVKGWYRAAKAALALEEFEECARLCVAGLDVESTNRDMKVLLRDAKRGVEKREAQARLDVDERARVSAYAEALRRKSIRIGPAVLGSGERWPTVDAHTGETTFWTLFVYPESMQTDVVEAVRESDALGAHLDALFDPSAPPLAWDSANAYRRESVEIYWQTNATVPYTYAQIETKMLDAAGVTRRDADDDTRREIVDAEKTKVDSRDQFMRLIVDPQTTTLGDLVKNNKDFVIAGHVVLFVVAKGTAFRQQFLDGEWEL